ncbi:MAG: PH domain-containing protein [Treponema sp.]|jgi:uncharacterized membrane protein YdbT with pleckstrin-like domain|nr:PH domain-containing protein [Treponema sp.]
MRFIKKKNLGVGEDLLYVPRLHWVYVVKHLFVSLPFFLILFIFWRMADTSIYYSTVAGYEIAMTYKLLFRYIFFLCVLAVLVVFVCRIFLYISTEYGVTNKRLMFKRGIIRLLTAEIPTDRIEAIYCTQGLLGRIFHYGTLCVCGIGGVKTVFYMVAKPYALRRKIVEIIEKNKAITIVHGDIPREEVPEPTVEVEKEPLYRYGTFVRVLPDGGK